MSGETANFNNNNNNNTNINNILSKAYWLEKLEKLRRLEISGHSAQTGVNWCIGSTLLS